MCLAIPAKVVEISKGKKGAKARADFGGVAREVDISLVDANIGDYVLVHAGFAIEIIDEHEAKETLELWREMLENRSDIEAGISETNTGKG
ncbi:MAG: HypC/HybG/HupF family hydrogenase formation chaperone [Halobacteriota archaeon]